MCKLQQKSANYGRFDATSVLMQNYSCSTWMKVFGKVRFTRSSRIQKLLGTVQEFWSRETSDDLLFIFLVLIDSFVVEVSLHSKRTQPHCQHMPSP